MKEGSVDEERNRACNVGWSPFPSMRAQSDLLVLEEVTQRGLSGAGFLSMTSSPLLALDSSHPLHTHQTR